MKLKLEIKYPEPLAEKCIRLEAAGEVFDHAMITIPALVKPGVQFHATVSLLAQDAMPIVSGGEVLTLSLEGGASLDVPFPKGKSAVACVDGLIVTEKGYFRLKGAVGDKEFVSNPSLCTDENRPLVLWGDPHIHTTVGDCHADTCRTRNLAYCAARYAYGLDFVAIADHVSWGCRGTEGKWKDNLALCELFEEENEFSALYCYETSMRGGDGGDCNVYMRQPNKGYVDPWPDEMNAAQLADKVEGHRMVIPHHTTRDGKHGEIPPEAYPGEELMPVVEIHSKWGTSEYRGNPTPLLKIHPGPSYAQDLLACGYRLGFIGGTDAHTSLTFGASMESEAHRSPPGLTAVMADSNNRNDIYDAIKNRNCYAAAGERILLSVDCNGLSMGQAVEAQREEAITLKAEYAAESEIISVDVIRNGQVVHTETPNDWKGSFEWTDDKMSEAEPIKYFVSGSDMVYYYVRVTAGNDARAWSSPCWLNLQ